MTITQPGTKQSIRTAAQNYLNEVFRTQPAQVVTYDDGGARIVGNETCTASGVRVNEEECNFQIDRRNGMERAVIPQAWAFPLNTEWPREVDLHEFSNRLFRKEIRVARTDTHEPFRILIMRYSAEHPVRKEPGHGTKATFQFQIEPLRGA